MRPIIGYIKRYFYETDKRVLALVTLLAAILIYLNYHFRIDSHIAQQNSFWASFLWRSVIFCVAFILPYLFYYFKSNTKSFVSLTFIFLLLIAPLIFSFKI